MNEYSHLIYSPRQPCIIHVPVPFLPGSMRTSHFCHCKSEFHFLLADFLRRLRGAGKGLADVFIYPQFLLR